MIMARIDFDKAHKELVDNCATRLARELKNLDNVRTAEAALADLIDEGVIGQPDYGCAIYGWDIITTLEDLPKLRKALGRTIKNDSGKSIKSADKNEIWIHCTIEGLSGVSIRYGHTLTPDDPCQIQTSTTPANTSRALVCSMPKLVAAPAAVAESPLESAVPSSDDF